jgi:hypothetical protein
MYKTFIILVLFIGLNNPIYSKKVILFGVDGLNYRCIHNATSNKAFEFFENHGILQF